MAATITWYTDALARRDGAALLTSIMEFQDLGMNLYAAEAAAAAVGLLREVRSSAAAGCRRGTRQAGGPLPGRANAGARRQAAGADNREREIARFAAAGVASKEIAERLYLSSRTVDNHLMRVYAKLGVSGRTELAAALRALPGLAEDE